MFSYYKIKAKIDNWYIQKRNNNVAENPVYPNVKWLSHHIPKTAGTSFYYTLEKVFGKDKILRAYYDFFYAKKLTEGIPVWVSKNTEVIHGHFEPHKNQDIYFPNAKHIIWLRDPLETNWSFYNQFMRNHDSLFYIYFYKKYLKDRNYNTATLFEFMINDKFFDRHTRVFSSYLKGFKKEDFDFVGHVDTYQKDMLRLAEVLNQPLEVFSENVVKKKIEMPFDQEKYKKILKSEYDILEQWI